MFACAICWCLESQQRRKETVNRNEKWQKRQMDLCKQPASVQLLCANDSMTQVYELSLTCGIIENQFEINFDVYRFEQICTLWNESSNVHIGHATAIIVHITTTMRKYFAVCIYNDDAQVTHNGNLVRFWFECRAYWWLGGWDDIMCSVRMLANYAKTIKTKTELSARRCCCCIHSSFLFVFIRSDWIVLMISRYLILVV